MWNWLWVGLVSVSSVAYRSLRHGLGICTVHKFPAAQPSLGKHARVTEISHPFPSTDCLKSQSASSPTAGMLRFNMDQTGSDVFSSHNVGALLGTLVNLRCRLNFLSTTGRTPTAKGLSGASKGLNCFAES